METVQDLRREPASRTPEPLPLLLQEMRNQRFEILRPLAGDAPAAVFNSF